MTYQEAVLKQKEKKTSMQQHTNLPGQLPTSNSKPPTTTKRGGGRYIRENKSGSFSDFKFSSIMKIASDMQTELIIKLISEFTQL